MGEGPLTDEKWVPPKSSTRAWVIYDLANTIFLFAVMGFGFPAWMADEGFTSSVLSWIQGVVGVIVVFAAPWVGSRTDFRGRRLPTLATTTLLAVGATMLLGAGPQWMTLAAFGVGLVGFNIGGVVYDAMLPDVSTPANRGRVSGLGVGVGYLGSAIGLGILALVRDLLGWGYATSFMFVGAAFLLFSIPTLLLVREPPRHPADGHPPRLGEAVTHLMAAWRRASGYPCIVRFLVSRFLYTDAINTLYAGFLTFFLLGELGFSDNLANAVGALAIAAAIPGGLASGRLVEQFGPLRVLRTALIVVTIAMGSAIFAALADQPNLAWVIGPLGGAAVAAIWSADRVLMARLSPPRYYGEFYGLFATVSRFAAILGPLLWGLVADVLGLGQSAAMCVLVCFVVAGFNGLRRVDDRERVWAQEDRS